MRFTYSLSLLLSILTVAIATSFSNHENSNHRFVVRKLRSSAPEQDELAPRLLGGIADSLGNTAETITQNIAGNVLHMIGELVQEGVRSALQFVPATLIASQPADEIDSGTLAALRGLPDGFKDFGCLSWSAWDRTGLAACLTD